MKLSRSYIHLAGEAWEHQVCAVRSMFLRCTETRCLLWPFSSSVLHAQTLPPDLQSHLSNSTLTTEGSEASQTVSETEHSNLSLIPDPFLDSFL